LLLLRVVALYWAKTSVRDGIPVTLKVGKCVKHRLKILAVGDGSSSSGRSAKVEGLDRYWENITFAILQLDNKGEPRHADREQDCREK
jgi:hypothetical protein